MIKNTLYGALITAWVASSVAVAEPPTSNPVRLTPAQMDMITAGTNATTNVVANAASNFMARTNTYAAALTTASNPNQPALSGYVAAAGGVGQAVAVGQGSSMNTSVTPTVNAGAPNALTFAVNIHATGSIVDISGNLTIQFGTFVSPL